MLQDKIWSAEALSCLEDSVFPLTKWYGNLEQDKIVNLILVIEKLNLVPLFISGGEDFLDEFLCNFTFDRIHVEGFSNHKSVLNKYYTFVEEYEMRAMVISKSSFIPQEKQATRLNADDIPEIKEVLRPYIDVSKFDASQVIQGIYYGVKKAGKIVSMAGTHNFSRKYRIGTIGNVVTVKEYRRQNLASLCCVQVLEEMFRICEDIIVKVDTKDNGVASLYEKLGFNRHCDYFEGLGKRRK